MNLTMTGWGKCGWNGIQGNDWGDVLITILTFFSSKALLPGFFLPLLNLTGRKSQISSMGSGEVNVERGILS